MTLAWILGLTLHWPLRFQRIFRHSLLVSLQGAIIGDRSLLHSTCEQALSSFYPVCQTLLKAASFLLSLNDPHTF